MHNVWFDCIVHSVCVIIVILLALSIQLSIDTCLIVYASLRQTACRRVLACWRVIVVDVVYVLVRYWIMCLLSVVVTAFVHLRLVCIVVAVIVLYSSENVGITWTEMYAKLGMNQDLLDTGLSRGDIYFTKGLYYMRRHVQAWCLCL
jgi:hypothetical protein